MARLSGFLAGVLLFLLVGTATGHGDDEHAHGEPAVNVSNPVDATHFNAHSHHGGTPKLVLNETEVLRQHGPSPYSYFDLDSGIAEELYGQYGSHSSMMTAHIVFMSLAFAIALPPMIYLRSAKHTFLAGFFQLAFLLFFGLGMLTGMVYSRSTPEMYKGQLHNKVGWITFFVAVGLSLAQMLRTVVILFRKTGSEDLGFLARLRHLFSSSSSGSTGYELVANSDEYGEDHESRPSSVRPSLGAGANAVNHNFPPVESRPEYWRRTHRHEASVDVAPFPIPRSASSSSRDGASSDDTLHEEHLSPRTLSPPIQDGPQGNPTRAIKEPDLPFSAHKSRGSFISACVKYLDIFLWRVLVLMAWVGIISGVAVYGGACQASYLNGCMAHLIKGSIFFWYGLLTFGRYCGAWAELGWAWNRKPDVRGTWREYFPSAEMVECAVIWLYGATNTWMERFGAQPGDPYTVKEVQHISIAVMFFFAGSAGMMLESKSVRGWISNAVLERVDSDKAAPPSSYSGSFNIFPAVCIGVTGIAMSAHHQEYQFSVTVHALWGTLLAGFSVFRILTYTFLYLRPPASILPSRPPTEALASLCLAAGGIVFISSTEEVIFWAMRRGADDPMAIMNVAVAFICFVFAWIMALMALKGWATRRTQRNSRPGSSMQTRHFVRKLAGAV